MHGETVKELVSVCLLHVLL